MFFKKKRQISIDLKEDRHVRLTITGLKPAEVVQVLYSGIVQLAAILKVDKRYLLNQFVELDKGIERDAKQKQKQADRDAFNAERAERKNPFVRVSP